MALNSIFSQISVELPSKLHSTTWNCETNSFNCVNLDEITIETISPQYKRQFHSNLHKFEKFSLQVTMHSSLIEAK